MPADLVRDVIHNHRAGSATVILQIPFDYGGKRYASVTIGPFKLDHKIRWREAGFKDWFALLCDIATDVDGKPMDPQVLRELRSPDDDRVIGVFETIMPAEIREAHFNKMWPVREPVQAQGVRPEAFEESADDTDDLFTPQPDSLSID